MIIEVKSPESMVNFGKKIGEFLDAGDVIELVGDVGAGKTTFTKGVALGLGIDEPIQSPTFTISRVYPARDDLTLAHYDFYRLSDAGVMSAELDEAVNDPRTVVVVEWAEVVHGVLPQSRMRIEITPQDESTRRVLLESPSQQLEKHLQEDGF